MLPEGLRLATYTKDYRNINLKKTGQVVAAHPVQVQMIVLTNIDASDPLYVKFYDKATAATASDTPVHTYPVPPNWIQPMQFGDEDYYANGLSIRATHLIADSDNTDPADNTCIVNLHYK